MKFLLPALFLIASVAADVSHLNNEYLPPVGHHHQHKHAEYAEQTREVPQVIGADTYTPAHLLEPSNSLVPEASQPEEQTIETFPQLQSRFEEPAANVETVEATQQFDVAYQQPAVELEQQPAEPVEAVEATQHQEVTYQQSAVEQEQQPAEEAPAQVVEAAEASQHQAVSFQFDTAVEQQPAEPAPAQAVEAAEASQHQAVSFQFDTAVEQQPAAQEFVPQTLGNIIYNRVGEQSPSAAFGQQEEQQYEAAASSGVDTQYGSNGGYVY